MVFLPKKMLFRDKLSSNPKCKSHERMICYHLKTLKIAREQNKIEKISFSDNEYEDFIASLLSDL